MSATPHMLWVVTVSPSDESESVAVVGVWDNEPEALAHGERVCAETFAHFSDKVLSTHLRGPDEHGDFCFDLEHEGQNFREGFVCVEPHRLNHFPTAAEQRFNYLSLLELLLTETKWS